MNALILKHVSKGFSRFLAVRDLSFKVAQGSIFGLLGPNGAGKTTTIRMIINIIAPDSGEIQLFGQTITPKFQPRLGYLPEERGLYPKRKIYDQLVFFGCLKGLAKSEAGKRVDDWLARLELSAYKKMTPGELSKGMSHKVQFIAAVLHDPEVMILDEPFSGLDPVSVSLLKEAILGLRQRGRTIIFSTHQMEQVEQICDEVCLIDRGTRVLGGTLMEIKQGFKNNKALLGYSGPDAFLDDESFGKIIRHQDHIEIDLKEPIDVHAQEILKRALAAGAVVTQFQLVEPTLNDIFIKIVRDKDGKAKADNNI